MRRSRRVPRHSSWSTCETMGSLPPPSPSKLRPRSRDTGFPSSFDGQRNTTLPHPDADLSPDACISADDIAIGRVLSRQRHSFLAKHKHILSHGRITPEMERTHSGNLVLLPEEDERPLSTQHAQSPNHDGASLASSNDSGVHVHAANGSDASAAGDRSFGAPSHDGGVHGHKRRRSLLTRLMHR